MKSLIEVVAVLSFISRKYKSEKRTEQLIRINRGIEYRYMGLMVSREAVGLKLVNVHVDSERGDRNP